MTVYIIHILTTLIYSPKERKQQITIKQCMRTVKAMHDCAGLLLEVVQACHLHKHKLNCSSSKLLVSPSLKQCIIDRG